MSLAFTQVFVSKCLIELYHEDNVPFTVITDSGTSVESGASKFTSLLIILFLFAEPSKQV